MINVFNNPEAFDAAVGEVKAMFGMDPRSKRTNTELQLIKLIADILNSKSEDWPGHDSSIPAAKRFINILQRARTVSGLFYDSTGFRPVASASFSGLRFYGYPAEPLLSPGYHILNLSYDALEQWYRQ